MRKQVVITLILLAISAVTASAQTPPTLRIVTETPGLPSELWYGNPGVKVKPVRLRPCTATPCPPGQPVQITIDDLDFFTQQQYVDFLTRFPETAGFNSWMTYLNGCNGDGNCLYGPNGRRTIASRGFFLSQEFSLKGGYVFRFYRASFGPTFAELPTYPEMVTGMNSVTGATEAEVIQKRDAFAANWVLHGDFITKYPRSLAPAQFVDAISTTAGVTLSNRQQIIDNLTAGGNTDAARGVAMKAIAESTEVQQKEFNPSFVFMQYIGYLRRAPEEAGYLAWLNYLNNNPTDVNTMVWGFVESAEYRNRF